MALTPSPTPHLVVTPLIPQMFAVLKLIPDQVWNALMGAVILAVIRWFLDMRLDRQKQTIKATMLELFNQFTEKNNEALRKAFLDSQRQASDNMIEIVKLEHTTKQLVQNLGEYETEIGRLVSRLEHHLKIDHKELR